MSSRSDRQALVQGMIESALRAAADPSVTAVLRSWDFYDDDSNVQQLLPVLIVSLANDEELGIGFGLYRASCSVSIVVDWASQIRDAFDRIRASVRSVMDSLPGLRIGLTHIDGVRELSCTEPDIVEDKGDVTAVQTLTYSVWFESPRPDPAVLDPTPYLIDRRPDGTTYVTTQAVDPRRIDRYAPSGATTLVYSQGYGAWSERDTLDYTAPVTPLSTSLPQPATS